MAKFRENGFIQNNKRRGENPILNETLGLAVLGQYKVHPYNIQLLWKLNKYDFDRRLPLCKIATERVKHNVNFLFNICYSEECTFFNSIVNNYYR